MTGVERINIISDWSDAYTRTQQELEPFANDIYWRIFNNIEYPLLDNKTSYINCNKNDLIGRYDWQEGVDVILHFQDGTKATMQEKFLTYWETTATFELMKSSGAPGAWFYCTAQYYFVGYKGQADFRDWILLDLASIHRYDKLIPWRFNQNNPEKLGRRATFKYVEFDNIPEECVIARKEQP